MWKQYRDTNYEVNELGKVRNKKTKRIINGHLVRGYVLITLGKGGKTVMLHRMVADTFIQPLTEDLDVHHKNGIKNDNRLCNLEVLTKDEHKIKHNYLRPVIAFNKETNLFEKVYPSIRDAEKERSLVKSHISSVVQNKTRHKSCDGSNWYYKTDRYELWKMLLKANVWEKFNSII